MENLAPKQLVIATRESALALWQSQYVLSLIEKSAPETKCTLLKMKTKGDKILDRALNEIGGKALFMKELEIAMEEGKADIAVHSLKDVPYELPKGFSLVAYTKRENPHDAFVSNHYHSLDALPKGAVVGTSSLRRKAQLLAYREDLVIKELRGNVNTRLNKLDNEEYDAIILAAAGLIRLGFERRIQMLIPFSISLPAVGQGVVVVECLNKDQTLIESLSAINHTESMLCANAERAFNEALEGGCHAPIAAHASFKGDLLQLSTMVASEDGQRLLKMNVKALNDEKPDELGRRVAKKMIARGAREILDNKG